jgi:phosphatidylglycerol---prolipoprotein diacylglyceryl transferase
MTRWRTGADRNAVGFIAVSSMLLLAWAAWVLPSHDDGSAGWVAPGLGLVVSPMAAYHLLWGLGLYVGGLAGVAVLRVRHAASTATLGALLLSGTAFLVGARLHYRLETLPLGDALSSHGFLTGGLRLPLGLLLGATVACGGAWLMRADWRATGDAWAVTASAVIAIGRMGCLAAGCCFGAVCSSRLSWLCVRHGPETETYGYQLQHQLIEPGASLSLPAYPLPAYFAVASLATIAALVWLLRRGAPAGALLLAFCILRPAAKLALEPLRADPRPALLMVGIPGVVLAGALIVLAGATRQRWLAGSTRRRLARGT